MTRCPSDLALEEYLLDSERGTVPAHLAACGACRERVAAMRRDGEEFMRTVYPRTRGAVEEAAAGRRRPWERWFSVILPAGGLAAAAAAMLLVSPQPPAGYLGAKGAPMAIQVWGSGEEGAREVADGAQVHAAAALRLRVITASPCRLWVVSVDASGGVSRLHPALGDPAPAPAGAATLPGGLVLDGASGPERLFAVCSADPLPAAEVEAAARDVASGGAEAVRRTRRLAGMPDGVSQASILLEKVP